MSDALRTLPDGIGTGAFFSPCRTYRYALWRVWEPSAPRFIVVGLNPSTADETQDDPTIRRCIGFAKREGCGSYFMLNLFGIRATDPKVMLAHPAPVGPENDDSITRVVGLPRSIVVAAWGAHGKHRNRAMEVKLLLERLGITVWCLGRTQQGAPRHPLYLAADTPIIRL